MTSWCMHDAVCTTAQAHTASTTSHPEAASSDENAARV